MTPGRGRTIRGIVVRDVARNRYEVDVPGLGTAELHGSEYMLVGVCHGIALVLQHMQPSTLAAVRQRPALRLVAPPST